MTEFGLFVYGTLRSGERAASRLSRCVKEGAGVVRGTLYDIDGRFPALLHYGTDVIEGEIWRCPADLLPLLDEYEGTTAGLFRRIGVEAETGTGERRPCWVYVAGPALSRQLIPERRVPRGTRQRDP